MLFADAIDNLLLIVITTDNLQCTSYQVCCVTILPMADCKSKCKSVISLTNEQVKQFKVSFISFSNLWMFIGFYNEYECQLLACLSTNLLAFQRKISLNPCMCVASGWKHFTCLRNTCQRLAYFCRIFMSHASLYFLNYQGYF